MTAAINSTLALHDALPIFDRFLTKMYRTNADFVFTVTRDFVRQCQTPVLILPDDIPPRSEEHTLNSSHITISYAVFCLKKKKKKKSKKHEAIKKTKEDDNI